MRVFRWLFVTLVVLVGSGAAVAVTYALYWARNLPSAVNLDEYNLQATSIMVDTTDRPFDKIEPRANGTSSGDSIDREIVALQDVSAAATAAIVYSEDNRFFEHVGFDPIGIARAVYQTLARNSSQGGSTLTQELVRNAILNDTTRTPERKIKEILLSVQVERYFTKQEILHTYLNVVFWGGQVHGIARASKVYLSKKPSDLTLAEGVFLASLLPAPNAFYGGNLNPQDKNFAADAADTFRRLRETMRTRLDGMLREGWITQAERDQAWREHFNPTGWSYTLQQNGELDPKHPPRYHLKGMPGSGSLAASRTLTCRNLGPTTTADPLHFRLAAEKELKDILGPDYVNLVYKGGGLKVFTTLQPDLQCAAEATVDRLRAPRGIALPMPGMQLGLASVDPYTGEVQALIGGMPGADGHYTDFDRATMSARSPGSSIKPILYAAAIEKGAQEWTTFDDKPVALPDKSQPTGVWTPKNFDGPKAYTNGPVTMRYALDHSLNLPTVRVGEYVGMTAFADKLKLLKFPDVPTSMPWAATIGGLPGGTNPLIMATAYATFVNGGIYNPPHFIRKVTSLNGDRVYFDAGAGKPEDHPRVYTKQAAFITLDMIRGVVNDPPSISGNYANAARLPGRAPLVGGKTGTSSDQKDLWFVGVTPELSAAVWLGFDDFGRRVPDSIYSGVYAPPIWAAYAQAALAGKPVRDYPAYRNLPGVSYRRVSGVNMASVTGPQVAQQDDAPVAATEASLPSPPASVDPPAQGGSGDLVVLDMCQTPPVLADVNTPPQCAEQRQVDPADLYRYAPGNP
ncbi:MAG TPA: transglycosylase domain-containing protein [Deinococcales bacterium]|nr:transglycosylase domain-containing protein [Deinococcales bacterium]